MYVSLNNKCILVWLHNGNESYLWTLEITFITGALTVDIHVIPNGDSLGNTNLVAKTLSIAATDSYQLYTGGEKLLLANGDTVQVIASAATGINSVVSFTAI